MDRAGAQGQLPVLEAERFATASDLPAIGDAIADSCERLVPFGNLVVVFFEPRADRNAVHPGTKQGGRTGVARQAISRHSPRDRARPRAASSSPSRSRGPTTTTGSSRRRGSARLACTGITGTSLASTGSWWHHCYLRGTWSATSRLDDPGGRWISPMLDPETGRSNPPPRRAKGSAASRRSAAALSPRRSTR